MTDLKTRMLDLGRRARAAAMLLREAPAAARTRALEILSAKLTAAEPALLAANARDVESARANGMTEALIDRLSLSPARIAGIAEAVACGVLDELNMLRASKAVVTAMISAPTSSTIFLASMTKFASL